MSPIIWDNCRRADGTISLQAAARQTGCLFTDQANEYLIAVERIMPIRSRQVATVAIATALEISAREPQHGEASK